MKGASCLNLSAYDGIPNQVDGFNLNVDQWTMAGSRGTYLLNADFADSNYGLHLTLQATEPPALHGDKGIIPYGPFGTSAYYSYTALSSFGTIVDHGVPIQVTGISWHDHQFGNPAKLVCRKNEPTGRARFLSRDVEYPKLCKIIAEKFPKHLNEFIVSVHTGMRLSEQYGCTWRQSPCRSKCHRAFVGCRKLLKGL